VTSRLVRRSLTAALVLALTTGSAAATGLEAQRSALTAPSLSGIGDPYFPLDGNGGIDVLRYRVHDTYRFGSRFLRGTTRVTLRATEDLDIFHLDFLLPVDSVTVDGRRAAFAKTDKGHELLISPRQMLHAGQKVDVVVRYAGLPGRKGYLGERNWLASDREVVTMNEPHMAPWWFPANDHPQDKALMDIIITVPKDKQVVANGRQAWRRVHGNLATYKWTTDEPMAPYLAFFAAGSFEIARGRRDGRPWLVAVSRQLSDRTVRQQLNLLKETPAIVAWLEGRLGPYPFSQTGGLVTSLDPGFALENQTRPTYMPTGRTTVVHELAHQWFGDSVSVERWRDIWLNEGFASFMEAAYAEAHGGQDAKQWLQAMHSTYGANDDIWKLDIADPGRGRIFDWAVYRRGAMALQALRNRVGEGDFWTTLRTWAADRAGGNGTVEDFQELAESISGEDLDGFFAAWLTAGTKPAPTIANGL
jgi:aminopeptidase N